MSSTSSSRLQRDLLAVMLAWPARRARLVLGDEDLAVGPVPGRDPMAPPQLARDAPGLDVLHPVEIGGLPILRHEARCGRASTASIAGSASVAASTYHWSVRRGSITALERSPCGTVWMCGSIFSIRPWASSCRTIILRAAKRNTPLNSRIVALSCGLGSTSCGELGIGIEQELALGAQDVDHRQAVPLAHLEIVEVVRRRDLDRAGALLGVGIFVGDDRDAAGRPAAGSRSCRPDACSARRRDARRRRCRRAWSRAAWWRRR